jgi:hypothetical protein
MLRSPLVKYGIENGPMPIYEFLGTVKEGYHEALPPERTTCVGATGDADEYSPA